MRITALVENTTDKKELKPAHGLSLYIETGKHKILVDTADGNTFIKNAERLGVDISAVDTLIITHGHFDHGGGLRHFLSVNKTAKVYLQASAFGRHYIRILRFIKVNAGLDAALKDHPQIILIDGDHRISGEMQIIANPSGKKLLSRFNSTLWRKDGKRAAPDEFTHEQSVIITSGKSVLIGGCAHRGIANIIDDAEAKSGKSIDVCISGFHLFNPATKATEYADAVKQLAAELSTHGTKFYTCHCTGLKAYGILKGAMQDGIDYLKTGQTIEV